MVKKMSKYNLKGWKIKEFLKGRDRLFITLIGAFAGYAATQNPALSGIIGAGTELMYSVIKYYFSE